MPDLLQKLVASEQTPFRRSIVVLLTPLAQTRLDESDVHLNRPLLSCAEMPEHWLGIHQTGLIQSKICPMAAVLKSSRRFTILALTGFKWMYLANSPGADP